MNYDYHLIRENLYVKEINLNNNLSEVWNIPKEVKDIDFLNDKKNFPNKNYLNSFMRCKKWLQEKHPELLL